MSFTPNTGSVELTAFRAHALRLLARGERVDQRQFGTYRTPTIVREERFTGSNDHSRSATSANNSLAAVMYTDNFGTCIQCTVEGLLGPPRPDRPAAGRLNVHVEAPFSEHLGGAMGTDCRSFQYLVTSGSADLPLRQLEGFIGTVLDGCFDLSSLSIYEREACWILTLKVTLLSFDGGLRSSSLHAALAALHEMHLPRARLPNGDVIEGRQLHLKCLPVACTFGFIAGAQIRLLTDTTAIEEEVVDGLITIAVGEEDQIVALHQTGRCPLLAQALAATVQQWISASAGVRKALYA